MEILSNGTIQNALNLADKTSDESDVLSQEDSTDFTAFLFPAVGALLIFMFGGLLCSSGTTFCKNKAMQESKIRRKFEQQFGRRAILFHNVPDKIAVEPVSVFQQENNDVVDAVKKEYQGLPQCQPISGFISNIVGLYGQTCAVSISEPVVTQRGVSPVHFSRKDGTLGNINPSSEDETRVSRENGGQSNQVNKSNRFSVVFDDETCARDHECETHAASSGIGTHSPTSYETDSLEEFPRTNDNQHSTSDYDEADMHNVSETHLSCDSPENQEVHCGGRVSVLQTLRAPTDIYIKGCGCCFHRVNYVEKTEIGTQTKRENVEWLTWRDVAFTERGNLDPPTKEGVLSSLTVDNTSKRNRTQLRRQSLEKWLKDVEQCRMLNSETRTQKRDSDKRTLEMRSMEHETRKKGDLGRRKMRAPPQESSLLLKRLQLVSDEDLQNEQNKTPVHKGGRLSCLRTVRAPSSLCLCGDNCIAHGPVEETSDHGSAQITPSISDTIDKDPNKETLPNNLHNSQINKEDNGHFTKGGRQSSLATVRAPSRMCIHGTSCDIHCQRINIGSKQKSQRRSSFEKTAAVDKGTSLSHQPHGASCFALENLHLKYEECHGQELRGASTFGELCDFSVHCPALRGASSFGAESVNDPGNEHAFSKSEDYNQPITITGEERGASCFASLDESNANTSSVTLSIVTASDAESVASNDQSFDSKITVQTSVARTQDSKETHTHTSNKENHTSDTGVHPHAGQLMDIGVKEGSFFVDVNANFKTENNVEESYALNSRNTKKDKEDKFLISRSSENKQQRYPSSGDRILKVGKDAAVMTSLLTALKRESGQKRKNSSIQRRTFS